MAGDDDHGKSLPGRGPDTGQVRTSTMSQPARQAQLLDEPAVAVCRLACGSWHTWSASAVTALQARLTTSAGRNPQGTAKEIAVDARLNYPGNPTTESARPGKSQVQTAADSRRWLILAVIAVAQLMITLDLTMMNLALPSAQRKTTFLPGWPGSRPPPPSAAPRSASRCW
jgi:hypothetical protein